MGMRGLLSGMAALLFATSPVWAALGGGDVVFPVPGMASVLFSHEYHVGKIKLRCNECHYGLYTDRAQHKTVGMAAMQKGRSCGACHNAAKAFAVTDTKHCATCHNTRNVVQ